MGCVREEVERRKMNYLKQTTNLHSNASVMMNESDEQGYGEYYSLFEPYSLNYRAVATVTYATLFLLGFAGNSVVILTIYVSESLHTSAYAYLVSFTWLMWNVVYAVISGFEAGYSWVMTTSGLCQFCAMPMHFSKPNVHSIVKH